MDILTERLKIRTLTKDDLYKLAPILADEDIVRFSLTGPLKEEKEAKTYLQRIMDHHARFGHGLYAIEEKKSGSLIGLAGLLSQNVKGENKVELAYRLSQNFWGMGLGLEAASAIADHAFTKLNINELITLVDSKNPKSVAIVERLGMRPWKETILFDIPVSVYLLQKIQVVPYREEWPQLYVKEKAKLEEALKPEEVRFYHIGSTSIPGCSAKPIIDILGTVEDISALDKIGNPLSSLGYEALGEYGMKGRRFFTRRDKVPVNLHIFEESDPEAERHLRFCEYLRREPAERDAYAELKQNLAQKNPSNIHRYCLGKDLAIKLIDIKAAEAIKEKLLKKEAAVKKEKWSPEEIQKAIELNLVRQVTTFAKYVPCMEIVFQKDAVCLKSEIPDDTYNIVMGVNFSKTKAPVRIKQIAELYTAEKLPFSFWIGPSDRPQDLEHHLKAAGLPLKEEAIAMAMSLTCFTKGKSPAGLSFSRSENPESLIEFSKVLESVGIPPVAYQKIYSKIPSILYSGDSPFEMHTAAIEGKTVATGMLAFAANVAGVYYVAVRPEERRKGYAQAMMDHLLQRAFERGYRLAVLEASKEGKELYEKIGFKSLSLFREYAWSPYHA